MNPGNLISLRGVEDYFYHQVRQAITNQQIETSPHTEFYLVRMLSGFCHRNSLFQSDEKDETPLAIRYLKSLKADREECIRLLKQLGDVSLYISGFFQDSLYGKNADLDYYITMGGSAYHRLHHIMDQSRVRATFRETFLELASRFKQFTEVLAEISDNSQISKSSDLLRLYEKWLTTGSQRILKKLNQFGIYPSSLPPSSTHN